MKNSDLSRFYGKDNMQNENGFARLNENGELDAPVSSNNIVPPEDTPEGKIMASDGVGGTKWVDDVSGTTVVANPTLAGTEADLTGLQVGDTKYKVPSGGGGKYLHQVKIHTLGTTFGVIVATIYIINQSISAIDSLEKLKTALENTCPAIGTTSLVSGQSYYGIVISAYVSNNAIKVDVSYASSVSSDTLGIELESTSDTIIEV